MWIFPEESLVNQPRSLVKVYGCRDANRMSIWIFDEPYTRQACPVPALHPLWEMLRAFMPIFRELNGRSPTRQVYVVRPQKREGVIKRKYAPSKSRERMTAEDSNNPLSNNTSEDNLTLVVRKMRFISSIYNSILHLKASFDFRNLRHL